VTYIKSLYTVDRLEHRMGGGCWGVHNQKKHVRISCYKSEIKYMCQPHEGTVGSVYVGLILTFKIIIPISFYVALRFGE